MMHSIWQSALLLGLYYVITAIVRNAHPLFKRNFLLGIVAVQLFTTLATFSFYYNGSFSVLQNSLQNLLPAEMPGRQWMELYAPWIFYIYSVVVIIRSSFQLRNWLSFKNDYSASLLKPSADIKMFTTSKAHQFGISKKVAIWYSNTIHTPIVFGFFKPMILLPVALINQLSISETEALIVHELTHIKYNDYLLNWLLLAAETIFFFNPFIRIMAGKIRLEREKNCDVQVLEFNYCSIGYADALLKTAKLRQHVRSFQLAAVYNHSQLLTRIRFFSVERKLSMRNRSGLSLSLVSLLVLVAFTVAVLNQPVKQLFRQGTVTEIAVTAENPALPASQPLISKASSVQKVIIEKTVAVTKQKTAAEQQNEIQPRLESLPANDIQEIKIVPVAFDATPAAEPKDVLINEESSNGKMITRAYRVKLKDGKWISEPLWIVAEMKANDSLRKASAADTLWKLKVTPVAQ